MNWILLVIAGLFETGFATCMGKAQASTGRESALWWLGFGVCMAISLLLLMRATSGPQALPIGTAYGIWTGIGAGGAVLSGILFFQEPVTFWRMFFLTVLILAIIGLKMSSPGEG